MYAHGFLCGVAVTLLAVTVALLIAEAVLKRKIRDMKKRTVREAVEVVRCKDCRHYHADTLSCDFTPHGQYYERPNWYEDDFCSYGERRTE